MGSSIMLREVTQVFVYYTLGLGLTIVAGATPDASQKLRQASPLKPWMLGSLGVVIAGLGYVGYSLIKTERSRRLQFSQFMTGVKAEIASHTRVPTATIQQHERLRNDLFQRFFADSEAYGTLQEADEAADQSGDLGASWQRRLPPEAKQELKGALIRRAMATLPCYEAAKNDYNAKGLLYERRLITDDHWASVCSDYKLLCLQIQFIIFDANCVEAGWATSPNGMFATASAILRHQSLKQKEEEARRQEEKRRQKEAKLKAQQEREEKVRAERQRKAADAAHDSLLNAVSQNKKKA